MSLSRIVDGAAVRAVPHAVLAEPLAGAAAGPVPGRRPDRLGRAVGAATGAVGAVVDKEVVLTAGWDQLIFALLAHVGLLLEIENYIS